MEPSKPTDPPVFRRRSMMIGFLVFGMLSGFTAAVLVLVWGGSMLAAVLAYALAGSIGLMGMAVTALWSA